MSTNTAIPPDPCQIGSISMAVLLTLVISLTGAGEAEAGQFGVSPLRISLSSEVRDTELNISNESDTLLSVQARAVRWTQDADGLDQMEPADEVVIFPRIAQIDVGASQPIRIALRGAAQAGPERAYRIFVEELPSQAAPDAPVQFTLQVSVPMFLGTGEARARLSLGDIRVTDGSLLVPVSNTGDAYGRLGQIAVKGRSASGVETFSKEIPGWYLLAGASRVFSAALTEEECSATASLEVTVRGESISMHGGARYDPADCTETENESSS